LVLPRINEVPPVTEVPPDAVAPRAAVGARRPWTVEDHYRAVAAAKAAGTVASTAGSVN
jgi:hypothetical protein